MFTSCGSVVNKTPAATACPPRLADSRTADQTDVQRSLYCRCLAFSALDCGGCRNCHTRTTPPTRRPNPLGGGPHCLTCLPRLACTVRPRGGHLPQTHRMVALPPAWVLRPTAPASHHFGRMLRRAAALPLRIMLPAVVDLPTATPFYRAYLPAQLVTLHLPAIPSDRPSPTVVVCTLPAISRYCLLPPLATAPCQPASLCTTACACSRGCTGLVVGYGWILGHTTLFTPVGSVLRWRTPPPLRFAPHHAHSYRSLGLHTWHTTTHHAYATAWHWVPGVYLPPTCICHGVTLRFYLWFVPAPLNL